MIEEQRLVSQMIAGDPAAEEKFWKLYQPRLYRASLYILGYNDCEAEDVVQDTFVIALSKIHQYDFAAPIYAWLRQICLRVCYSRIRNRNRTTLSEEKDLELYLQNGAIDRQEKDALNVQKRMRLDQVTRLQKHLNPASAAIIQLRDVQGKTYAQISTELNVPIGTVMSRLARAREQLRKLVEAQPDLTVIKSFEFK